MGLNATTLVEVRGDLSPLADMDVGLLSLQDMLHQAVRFATFAPGALLHKLSWSGFHRDGIGKSRLCFSGRLLAGLCYSSLQWT